MATRTVVYEVIEYIAVEVDGDPVPDTYWRARKKVHSNKGKRLGRRTINYIHSY